LIDSEGFVSNSSQNMSKYTGKIETMDMFFSWCHKVVFLLKVGSLHSSDSAVQTLQNLFEYHFADPTVKPTVFQRLADATKDVSKGKIRNNPFFFIH